MKQAPDGSIYVTLTDDGAPISVAVVGSLGSSDFGFYAPDGSMRVTFVGSDTAVIITDQTEVTVGGSTYTFTVEDGEITQIDVT